MVPVRELVLPAERPGRPELDVVLAADEPRGGRRYERLVDVAYDVWFGWGNGSDVAVQIDGDTYMRCQL